MSDDTELTAEDVDEASTVWRLAFQRLGDRIEAINDEELTRLWNRLVVAELRKNDVDKRNIKELWERQETRDALDGRPWGFGPDRG